MEEKKCTKCGETKPLNDFRKRNNGKYYRSWCKKCELYYCNNEAPNAFWSKLKGNLKRCYPSFSATPTELKQALGKPHICYICGDEIKNVKYAELDHVIPLSKGGETSIDNLKWTHKLCNRMKHDLYLDEMLKHIEKILKYQNHI